MDKQQAQRAVFQLRRKVVNSAKPTTPVNKYGEPETEVAAPNWERLKIDVRERIDALAGIMSDRCSESPERKAKLWSDLIRPNVKLLAEFCSNVSFDGEREPITDNTGVEVEHACEYPPVVDLDSQRPHAVGIAVCGACGHRQVSVAIADARGPLECALCHSMASVFEGAENED